MEWNGISTIVLLKYMYHKATNSYVRFMQITSQVQIAKNLYHINITIHKILECIIKNLHKFIKLSKYRFTVLLAGGPESFLASSHKIAALGIAYTCIILDTNL